MPRNMRSTVVGWSLRPCDGMNDMARQGTSSDHYRGARCRGLSDSGAAKHLRGSLAAAAGEEVDPLFDPYRELAEAADVPDRYRGQREEGRRGCALELVPAHFAA